MTQASLPVPPQPSTPAASLPYSRPWTPVELIALLLAPVAAYVLMHFKPYGQNGFLDPYMYTGYIHNFEELFEQFGLTYYGVRFGLILPSRVFAAAFGPVAGYFALRYVLLLLGAIPFYALVRQLYGRAVAAALLAVLVTSPYLARAMLWDHPDAVGAPLLLGALSLLQIEHRRRHLLDVVAGLFAGLALNSNVFVIGPLGAYLGTSAVLWIIRRRGVGALALRILCFGAGVLAICAMGAAYYAYAIGQWDVFTITYNTAVWLASGGTLTWRTSGFAWTLRLWAVFTPVLLTCLAAAAVLRRPMLFQEQVVVAGAAATTAFFYANQFLMDGNSLELFYYLSYALPAVFLLLAVVLGRVVRGGLTPLPPLVFAAAAIVPWVLYALDVTTFAGWTIGHHLVAALVAGGLVAAAARSGTPRRAVTAAAAVALGVLFWSSFARPTYAGMVNSWSRPDGRERDVYAVTLQLIDVVEDWTAGEGQFRFWYSNRPLSNSMQSIQAVYLWGTSKIQAEGPGLPVLEPMDFERLASPDVRWLVLLAENRRQFADAYQTLRGHHVNYRVRAARDLSAGNYRLHVQLLELTKD